MSGVRNIMDYWRAEWRKVTDHSAATNLGKLFAQSDDVTNKRPKWVDVYNGYPKDIDGDDLEATEVFKRVFGSYYDENTHMLTWKDKSSVLDNACATRVSMALISAGFLLSEGDYYGKMGIYKNKRIATKVNVLKKALLASPQFGTADVIISTEKDNNNKTKRGQISLSEVRDEIGERNGIYIVVPYPGIWDGTNGHATLWVSDEYNVIGGHSYEYVIGEMYFWELK